MIDFKLLTEVTNALDRIFSDETRKHLIEASEHIKDAADEIAGAMFLVLEIVENITNGETSRDMLTAEVVGMLPDDLKEKKV